MAGDLTIRRRQRQTAMGSAHPPSECTEYMQVDRRREEHRGCFGYRFWPTGRTLYRPSPRTALITRCDLEQTFLLNLDDREYTAWPVRTYPRIEERLPQNVPSEQLIQRAPTVLVETETVDTGERKDFFGRTARHVITTRRIVPLDRAKQGRRETVTDGWYIDPRDAYFLRPLVAMGPHRSRVCDLSHKGRGRRRPDLQRHR